MSSSDKTAPAPGGRHRRGRAERGFLRAVGTVAIIGVGTAIGAILGSQDVSNWVTGLVVAVVSVVLAALLRLTLRA